MKNGDAFGKGDSLMDLKTSIYLIVKMNLRA